MLNSLNKKPVENLRDVARGKIVVGARHLRCRTSRTHNLTAVATRLAEHKIAKIYARVNTWSFLTAASLSKLQKIDPGNH